jgi:hypothetical protein
LELLLATILWINGLATTLYRLNTIIRGNCHAAGTTLKEYTKSAAIDVRSSAKSCYCIGDSIAGTAYYTISHFKSYQQRRMCLRIQRVFWCGPVIGKHYQRHATSYGHNIEQPWLSARIESQSIQKVSKKENSETSSIGQILNLPETLELLLGLHTFG